MTQQEKARVFRSLHERDRAFLIPNPWDRGSARMLEALGFEALATTSAGSAFARGERDYATTREQALAHAREIVSVTDLPVSADFENGFGYEPDVVAESVRLAAGTGLAGCSIEDAVDRAVYDRSFAAERIRAAAEVVGSLGYPFTLTARAENYLVGRPDLHDTIARLQSYQEAGADVLYAPGLRTRDDIAAVVSSVDKPVNVIMGLVGVKFTVDELSELGVKRISVGGSLSRVAYGAMLRAGREMLELGTFGFADDAVPMAEISGMLGPRK